VTAEEPRERDGRAAAPAVGHVLNTYLARSATFIHTALRFQRRVRPVVLARRTENLGEFPHQPVVRLLPDSRAYRRVARSFPALARGSYDRRLVRAARRHGCVALHAHFGWAACDSLDARRTLGLPLVTTFYGNDLAPVYAERYPYPRLFAEGDRFLCEGPAMAARLAELGCPPDRIRIAPIGLDLEAFPFRPAVRSRPLVVLQAARFVEKKGFDLTLQAYAAARDGLGPSELWLVGDGPCRAELERLAGRLGIEGSVRFLGMLPHDEYRAAMRRAHVCIQPSRTAADGDSEGGAPTVLLEMQAAGIPVVATRHADIPSVVADPGALVEEEDVDGLAAALVRLAGLPEDNWRTLAEHGRALVEAEHDARSVAGKVEALYGELSGAGA
jgi:colanic acid/amylovoran biosynthesis glycosyltransferase